MKTCPSSLHSEGVSHARLGLADCLDYAWLVGRCANAAGKRMGPFWCAVLEIDLIGSKEENITMSIIYRQGDVLLIKQERLPENAKPAPHEANRIVLAYGEATGHAHALDIKYAAVYQLGGTTFIEAMDGATVTHEEHREIALQSGVYKIVRQREYTPQEVRYVRD